MKMVLTDLDETLLVSKDTVKLVNDVDAVDNYEEYFWKYLKSIIPK